MFESVFSLQGRIGRMPFFLGSLGLGVATVVGIVALAAGGRVAVKHHDYVVIAVLFVALLPVGVAGMWCNLSLHVRRLRDMGWDPTLVVAGWLIFKIVDKLVLVHLLPTLATHGPWHGTTIGSLVDFGLFLLLRFWPSQDGHADWAAQDARDLLPGPPRWAASGRLAPDPSPIPAARLARVTAGGRREFGRR